MGDALTAGQRAYRDRMMAHRKSLSGIIERLENVAEAVADGAPRSQSLQLLRSAIHDARALERSGHDG